MILQRQGLTFLPDNSGKVDLFQVPAPSKQDAPIAFTVRGLKQTTRMVGGGHRLSPCTRRVFDLLIIEIMREGHIYAAVIGTRSTVLVTRPFISTFGENFEVEIVAASTWDDIDLLWGCNIWHSSHRGVTYFPSLYRLAHVLARSQSLKGSHSSWSSVRASTHSRRSSSHLPTTGNHISHLDS
jgi:hypothetical protein